jgi:protein O-mannosyl-transferase
MFGMNPVGTTPPTCFSMRQRGASVFDSGARTGFVWRSLGSPRSLLCTPINVESVAWIAERKNVLSMFFFLVALAAYGWYARRPGIGRYLAVTLAYVLSLMSKGQGLRSRLLCCCWTTGRLRRMGALGRSWKRSRCCTCPQRSLWSLILEKVPWIALSAVSAVITVNTGGAAFSYVVLTDATVLRFPLWIRLATAAIGYVKYLGKAFWPVNLAVVYPHPGFATSIPAAVLSALLIINITALAVIFRQRKAFFVGWFWFLGTMVPMIGMVQIGAHAMADRYAYIPLLGIFVIVSWGAADLIKRWHVPMAVSATGAAVILLMLGFALHRQVSYWGDNVTLWTHTLEAPGKLYFPAEENLAMALIADGQDRGSLAALAAGAPPAAARPTGHAQSRNLPANAWQLSGCARWLCDCGSIHGRSVIAGDRRAPTADTRTSR